MRKQTLASIHPRKQTKRRSYALGSAQASFAAPVQRGSHGAYVAAAAPAAAAAAGGAPSLVLLQPSAGTEGNNKAVAAARSILDSQPQVRLPGPLHSVHALAAGGGPAGSVAVVMADGSVAGADFEHHKLRLLPSAAGAAAGAGAGASGRGGASARGAAAGPGRPAAADAAGGCLVVGWQAGGAGAAATLAFYGATKAHPFVEHLCSCELAAPSAGARLLSLHLAPRGVAACWSGAAVSHHAFDYRARGLRAPSGGAFDASALCEQLGADANAGAAGDGGGATPAGGRKRKATAAPAAGGGGASPLLVAALSDTQLLLAAVAADGGSAALRHAVVDSRYGCVLSTGRAPLALAAGALESAAPRLVVVAGADGGSEAARVAVGAGGGVFVVSVHAPRADLAGLLGRLAVEAGAGAPKPAAAVQLPRVGAAPASAGGAVTAAACQLDIGALVESAVQEQEQVAGAQPDQQQQQQQRRQQQQQQQQQQAAVEDGQLPLVPTCEPADATPERDALAAAALELAAALDARAPAAAAGSRRGGGSGAAAALDKRLEAAVRALVQQLTAQAAAQVHPARAASQRRRRSSTAAQQLLGRAAEALADARAWPLLRELLAAAPLRSLSRAPRLLGAAAAAHQHELVAELCRAAEDAPADCLLDALAALLGSAAASPDGKAAASARRAQLRRAAASAVDGATAAEASGEFADPARAAAWLACARAASAAVDGFSARELCLHPLAAADVDAAEAQAALQRLPARAALRLLRYLAKWAAAHGEQPLEAAQAAAAAAAAHADAAAGGAAAAARRARRGGGHGGGNDSGGGGGALQAPVLPAELRAPSWGQVLDWLRALLDAHLTKFAVMPAAAAPLRALADAVAGHAAAAARLAPLRGVAEHMLAGAPLPAAATAAASSYTVELLDLRVRTH